MQRYSQDGSSKQQSCVGESTSEKGFYQEMYGDLGPLYTSIFCSIFRCIFAVFSLSVHPLSLPPKNTATEKKIHRWKWSARGTYFRRCIITVLFRVWDNLCLGIVSSCRSLKAFIVFHHRSSNAIRSKTKYRPKCYYYHSRSMLSPQPLAASFATVLLRRWKKQRSWLNEKKWAAVNDATADIEAERLLFRLEAGETKKMKRSSSLQNVKGKGHRCCKVSWRLL